MAVLDSERIASPGSARERAAEASRKVRQWMATLATKLRLDRFFTSLARRIFLANLIGLAVLIGGIFYIMQHQAWLIDAKRESLRVQGKIIAAAIAANAKVVGTGDITLEPDKLPNVEDARLPFRDDAFAALELSITPHEVTPILRRLIKPTNTRARIYSRDFTLIADSNKMLTRQRFAESELTRARKKKKPEGQRPAPLRSFWTRVNAWLTPNTLPVYREIDSADGRRYREVRVAMTGQEMELVLLDADHQQIVSLATPIKRINAVQGVLLLSTNPGEIDEILSRERWVLLLVSALALMATLAASALLTQTISRPMRRLSEAAKHVRRDIKAKAELPEFPNRTDEVGQVAVAFRDMTAALYTRIETSEKFAADVAHELKNPLTAARSTVEALTYAKSDEQRDELMGQVQSELQRLNRLITDVADASRLDAELALHEAEPVDLAEVVTSVGSVFTDLLNGDGRSIELDLAGLATGARDFVVNGHEGRLAQVVTNLVDNAISFSPDNGVVTVRARRIGPQVEICVEDQGCGIPEDKLEDIFSRFYSDRPATEAERGKNSGLGLSISKDIIVAHQGKIWAKNLGKPLARQSRKQSEESGNRAGDGASFIFRLPAAYASGGRTGGRFGRRS